MRRILAALLCLAAIVGARADVIELQDGTKSEGRVLALFNQRFEVAGNDGTVTHLSLQQIKRIDFDSETATLTTRKHTILNGLARSLENGSLTITTPNGADQRIAAVDVDDLTVSSKDSGPPSKLAPPPPPLKPATIPAHLLVRVLKPRAPSALNAARSRSSISMPIGAAPAGASARFSKRPRKAIPASPCKRSISTNIATSRRNTTSPPSRASSSTTRKAASWTP